MLLQNNEDVSESACEAPAAAAAVSAGATGSASLSFLNMKAMFNVNGKIEWVLHSPESLKEGNPPTVRDPGATQPFPTVCFDFTMDPKSFGIKKTLEIEQCCVLTIFLNGHSREH